MSEWKECKLGEAPFEIIDGDRGTNYPKQNEFYQNAHCLFLSAKNVTSNGFSFNECCFITKQKDEMLRKGKLQRHDIVLTTRGTVGSIGFFNGKVPFKNIRINSGMVIIRPNPKWILPEFTYQLFKYLKSDFDVFATGSAQPQLPIRDLKEIDILIPPLHEQKAIASVLSSLDNKIDLLHRQNKTLEAMAETLFRQWFIEAAPQPSPNLSQGERDKVAEEGWKDGRIGQLIEISSEKSLKREKFNETGLYPVLGANGEIGRTDGYLFDEKLIFTGRVGTLGNIFIVDNDKVWLSDNTLVIRPKIFFYYVYFILKTAKLQEYNVGSTQPLIRQSDIKEIEVALPTDKVLKQFENKAEILFCKINFNKNQIGILFSVPIYGVKREITAHDQ